MNRLNIIRSTTWTPSVVVPSNLHPIARVSGLDTNAPEISVTAVKPSTARVSLDRPASTQRLRTASHRSHWTRVGDTLAVEGMAATRPPPRTPHAAAANAPDLVASPPAPAPAKQPPAIAKVELTIDSLGSYELNKPIPVFVESLGNRHFVAEVPDLNISTSANSLSDILIVLKDRVTQTYDTLRLRKNLDTEQMRQLKVLETYIGRSRRGWLDRR
jgi:hypothetical protein